MDKITPKEEEILQLFWRHGEMFVRELLQHYPDPKPHFNTSSTMVRSLETKGFLAYKSLGNSYKYYPIISQKQFGQKTIAKVIKIYMQNSYLNAVSALVDEQKISLNQLREIIDKIEKKH